MNAARLFMILLFLCMGKVLFSQDARSSKVEFMLNNLPDTEGPEIILLSPGTSADDRFLANTDWIELYGEVKDESGVKYIAVKGEKVEMDGSGRFSSRISLYPGDNIIRLVSSDVYHNLRELYVNIVYLPVLEISAASAKDESGRQLE